MHFLMQSLEIIMVERRRFTSLRIVLKLGNVEYSQHVEHVSVGVETTNMKIGEAATAVAGPFPDNRTRKPNTKTKRLHFLE